MTSAATAPTTPAADAPVMKRKVKRRRFDAWGVVAWSVGLGCFFPVFWMVLASFKQEVDASHAVAEVLLRSEPFPR